MSVDNKTKQAPTTSTAKLQLFVETCKVVVKEKLAAPTPQSIVELAQQVNWGVDDILAMFDAHEQLPETIIFESQKLYEEYMVEEH